MSGVEREGVPTLWVLRGLWGGGIIDLRTGIWIPYRSRVGASRLSQASSRLDHPTETETTARSSGRSQPGAHTPSAIGTRTQAEEALNDGLGTGSGRSPGRDHPNRRQCPQRGTHQPDTHREKKGTHTRRRARQTPCPPSAATTRLGLYPADAHRRHLEGGEHGLTSPAKASPSERRRHLDRPTSGLGEDFTPTSRPARVPASSPLQGRASAPSPTVEQGPQPRPGSRRGPRPQTQTGTDRPARTTDPAAPDTNPGQTAASPSLTACSPTTTNPAPVSDPGKHPPLRR